MPLRLDRQTTGLLVVDYQERLCAAMPAAVLERSTRNVCNLLTLAARLELPVVASEQYPKGLGPTLPAIAALLPQAALPKTAFSVMGDRALAEAIRSTGRRAWIVVGVEAHVCVYQTARDLVGAGLEVQVPADTVISRTKANWRVGLELTRAAGAVVTSAEIVLFDLLGEGRGEVFKEMSRLIR